MGGMRARFFLLLAGLWLSLLAVPAFAKLPYRTRIVGAKPERLSNLLNQVSELKALEKRPPHSKEALKRRAEHDLDLLKEAASSLGYWGAHFSTSFNFSAHPAVVTVRVAPGPLYHVKTLGILGPQGRPLSIPRPKGAPPLPLKPGDPARTAPVVAMGEALIERLKEEGRPFAKILRRRVVIDKGTLSMTVRWRLDPGPVLRFGAVTVKGLKTLAKGYVERRVRWRRGALYDIRKVAATRRALIASDLFSMVLITPSRVPGHPHEAAMTIALSESAPHTVGAGIAYNTNVGAGVRLFWEDRNLFGHAEDLRLSGEFGQQIKGASANFRRPDFLASDQDLLAVAKIEDETPIAYHSRRAEASSGLERRFGRFFTGGAALSVEKANVVQLADLSLITPSERTQHYALIGLPLYVKYDSTNSLLNPTRGLRAEFATTPYESFSGSHLAFVSNWASLSTYRRLDSRGRWVFAVRGAVASIEGEPSLLSIPADKRVYVGGGGSIRAYGYEMAGPLDSEGRPIGGKSSLAVDLELRIRITRDFGIVPFIDAGSYYEKSVPQLTERVFYGPGLGFRYYTAFGPVRLDIATPLDRRHPDAPIQFYISIGQAF